MTSDEPARKPPGKPLDADGDVLLKSLTLELQNNLLYHANRISSGSQITAEDLEKAFTHLEFLNRETLEEVFAFADAQAVITLALKENKIVEWVSYGMAVILFSFGLFLLGVGVAHDDAGTRVGAFVGGSIVELLILIPFRFAINSRRHNIALRMLGLILNRVNDPAKVAPLLKETFLSVVLGKAQFKSGN